MRLIDIEPYEKYKDVMSCSVRQYLSGEGYVSECCTDTRGIPTVDAVPVVRCKDCKYNGDDEECPLLSMFAYTSHEGFCSYGERRIHTPSFHSDTTSL